MNSSRGALRCLLLSVVGIGLSAYLTFVHVALLRGELVGGAACGSAGTWWNCHAVTGSAFSQVAGLPLSLWGLLGYLLTFSLSLVAWQLPEWSASAFVSLVGLSLAFVIADLFLLGVMVWHIQRLCPLCLATYLVNLVLLLIASRAAALPWSQLLRRWPAAFASLRPRPRVPAGWIVWGIVGTGALGVWSVHAATSFVTQGPPGALHKQMAQFVSQQRRVEVRTSGDPMLGDPARPIQMVEFSDFLCPSCARAFRFNPILLAGRRDVAFVFKHFPLDMTCNSTMRRTVHPHACELAAATECAHEQGKFWALHDRIFETDAKYDSTRLDQDAQAIGLDLAAFQACRESGRGMAAVRQDVEEGARLNVVSTPTYFIHGYPVTGVLSPPVFEELLRSIRHPTAANRAVSAPPPSASEPPSTTH